MADHCRQEATNSSTPEQHDSTMPAVLTRLTPEARSKIAAIVANAPPLDPHTATHLARLLTQPTISE